MDDVSECTESEINQSFDVWVCPLVFVSAALCAHDKQRARLILLPTQIRETWPRLTPTYTQHPTFTLCWELWQPFISAQMSSLHSLRPCRGGKVNCIQKTVKAGTTPQVAHIQLCWLSRKTEANSEAIKMTERNYDIYIIYIYIDIYIYIHTFFTLYSIV